LHSRQKGNEVESLVRHWLEGKGLTFLQSNYTRRVGEIDLVFSEPEDRIVFVEVRFRSSEFFGGAIGSISAQKRRKLIRTANSWLQRYANGETQARIDVVAVSPYSPENTVAPTDVRSERSGNYQLIWIRNAIEE